MVKKVFVPMQKNQYKKKQPVPVCRISRKTHVIFERSLSERINLLFFPLVYYREGQTLQIHAMELEGIDRDLFFCIQSRGRRQPIALVT
nr:hypothetical protein BCV14_13870 [Vibrio cyclitrophicus]